MITTWAKSRPGHNILNGQENYSKGTNPLVQTSLRTESSYLKVLITLKFHICFFEPRHIWTSCLRHDIPNVASKSRHAQCSA
jgi:hypothetical protein